MCNVFVFVYSRQKECEPLYAFVEPTGEGERSEFNEFVKRLDVLHTEYVHKQVMVLSIMSI